MTNMNWIGRRMGMLAIAATAFAGLGVTAASADPDNHDRYERHDDGGRHDDHETHDWRYERHHDYRHDEWDQHRRVYYGGEYVTAPPPVYYAPPPPPSGLNLFFNVR